MTNSTETNPPPTEEFLRTVDAERPAQASPEAERMAKHIGVSIEELDRRVHNIEHERDKAGLPQLSHTQVIERVQVDDFGKDVGQQQPASTKVEPDKLQAKDKADGESELDKAAKDAAEQRRLDALNAVNARYIVGKDGGYYEKGDQGRLAFQDQGNAIKSRESDSFTAASMATLAQAKGWDAIKVSGTEQFKAQVWLEATMKGLEVRGYKPNERDFAVLAERQAREARNGIEPVEPSKASPARTPADRSDERKVWDAVASKVLDQHVKNPQVRGRVKAELAKQLDRHEGAGGKLPAAKQYDASMQPDRANRPPVERAAERSR